MKTIRGLGEELAERLELPQEAIGGALRLTALDDRRLLIENHGGLLALGTEEIRVGREGGALAVRGAALELGAMDRRVLLITGRLQSLAWE